jgi:hypothetical protein
MGVSNEFLVPSFQFPALATLYLGESHEDWELFHGRRYFNIV